MAATDTTMTNVNKMKKYTHSSKAEWDTFKNDFTDLLNLHKDKLDTPATEGKLNPMIERKAKAEARADAKADALDASDVPALITARVDEYLQDALHTAFSLLMHCIDNESLKTKLRAKHNHDAYAAMKYINDEWSVSDNDTRIRILVDRRRDFVDEGLTKLNLAGAKEFADSLAKFNRELEGTVYHVPDANSTSELLDAVSVHDRELVKNF